MNESYEDRDPEIDEKNRNVYINFGYTQLEEIERTLNRPLSIVIDMKDKSKTVINWRQKGLSEINKHYILILITELFDVV